MTTGSISKFGVAVLGLGRMGRIHTKNLVMSGRAQVKWLMRNDLSAARELASRFEIPPHVASPSQLDQVLQDPEYGKCVLSEKPVTPDLESTRECYQLAERKGKPLLCAFHRRFDPSFMSVKNQVQSNRAGRLRLLRISSHDPTGPSLSYIQSSGGIIKDSTIHDLDMALWMTGSPAERIHVTSRAFDPDIKACGDADLALVVIQHQNGTVTVIDNGRRCAYGYDQRLEAICEEGSYFVDNRGTHTAVCKTTFTSVQPPIDQMFDTRYPEAYSNVMTHFMDVMGGAAPKVSKADTITAMELAEAAMESMQSGQAVAMKPT